MVEICLPSAKYIRRFLRRSVKQEFLVISDDLWDCMYYICTILFLREVLQDELAPKELKRRQISVASH